MTISVRTGKVVSLILIIAFLLTAPAGWVAQVRVPVERHDSQPIAVQSLIANVDQSLPLSSLDRFGLTNHEPVPGLSDTWVLNFDSADDAQAAFDWLSGQPGANWVEPDRMVDYSYSPGDPLSQDQLWIESIDLGGAWTITTGHASIVVAVVDSGVSRTHPDLEGKVLQGYDFLNGHDDPVDDVGHGTAVAGIIGARGGDGIGIAGIAMDTTILPVKVGSLDGSPISAIAAGIVWSVDQGADVINLSLGADFPSETLHAAVRYAYDRNVPVVAAAGNEPESISYPGAYPEAISVGASTLWGTLTGFTTRANRVDLVAPGSSVLTTWTDQDEGDTWATVTGTSFAAPMVSGTLALLLSLDTSLGVEDLRDVVRSATIAVGEGDPEPGAGAGQLDAGASLSSYLARAFDDTWRPADSPVASGVAERTWVWGPDPIATGFETYDQAAQGERLIRYYDKARMEITDPASLGVDPWFVTNGLLARELITGNMQLGDQTFLARPPARIVVAGDVGDPSSPTYADFGTRLNAEPAAAGELLTSRISVNGVVSSDSRFAQYEVFAAWYVAETNHQIASVFWNYLNSMGLIDMGGDLVVGPIFQPTFYATGLPITEAYWTEVRLNGVITDVLVQCFERRCLTYTPANPENWQVEMGNVGQHYYSWRYTAEPQSANGVRLPHRMGFRIFG